MNQFLGPLSFVFIMALAFTLKKVGFIQPDESRVVNKLLMNLALPCTIIVTFASLRSTENLLQVCMFGFVASLLPILVIYRMTTKMANYSRAVVMLNISGFNIGCFALPFIQLYFGNEGGVLATIFDTGNALLVTGGSYVLTQYLLPEADGERMTMKDVVRNLSQSVPFVTYIIMFILAFLGWKLPHAVNQILIPIGAATPFLAMFMLGLLFNPHVELSQLKIALGLTALRLCWGVLFSVTAYYWLPFDLLTRQVLSVVVFAPASALAPIYSMKLKADVQLSAFTNSLTIISGVAIMSTLSILYTGGLN